MSSQLLLNTTEIGNADNHKQVISSHVGFCSRVEETEHRQMVSLFSLSCLDCMEPSIRLSRYPDTPKYNVYCMRCFVHPNMVPANSTNCSMKHRWRLIPQCVFFPSAVPSLYLKTTNVTNDSAKCSKWTTAHVPERHSLLT